ncbi:hypothetical protein B1B_09445, partial [mine drainage metagenome]
MSGRRILSLNTQTQGALNVIVADLWVHGGTVTVVGGSVRDMLLGLPAHDLDLEVSGLDTETLRQVLVNKFSLDETGALFSVLKVRFPGTDEVIDVALPRTEELIGVGHRDFKMTLDKDL